MVTAVAQCGVDINAAAAHPWRQPALQFVPGLGPRKAAALVKAVARSGNMLESRWACVA
jgi:transcription elongation factor SPT6